MKRPEIRAALVGLLVLLVPTAALISSCSSDENGGLREANQELDRAEAELARLEVELARALDARDPIIREFGHQSYRNGKMSTVITSVTYFGSEYSGLESSIRIEAEGDFGIRDPVPVLVIRCQADGLRRVLVRNLTQEPQWNDEYARHEYFAAYLVSPTPETLPIGERSARWSAYREFKFADRWEAWPTLEGLLYLQLLEADEVEIVLTGLDGEELGLRFVMTGAFETPIQPNLDQCGDYW